MSGQYLRKFSIIVPSCNFKLLKSCLSSIVRYTDFRKSNAEVICCLNGCEEEAKTHIEGLGPHFSYVWDDNRIGVCSAVNNAVKRSCGEYVIKMDDDCELICGITDSLWLDMLERPFCSDAEVGMTGVWLQDFTGHENNYTGGEKDRRITNKKMMALVGFLMMTTRSIWDQVGGFDEEFNPGVGEDTDFCFNVCCLGYRLATAGYVWGYEANNAESAMFPVWHKASGNYNHDMISLRIRNEKLLNKKWGSSLS